MPQKTKWFDGVDERLLDDDLETEEAVEVDMDGVEAVVQEGERRQEARINLARWVKASPAPLFGLP